MKEPERFPAEQHYLEALAITEAVIRWAEERIG